jgi:DNA polymerase-3 subunit gamma/tau
MAKKKVAEAVETPVDAAAGTPPEGAGREAEYTVVARRYRPQRFEQLVGQDAVAQSLGNAIKSGRVAHAYLFTGARGVGKTSTARILAKCLNCEKGPTLTPCDECEMCHNIAAGEDVDVLEIDGASNRGIDEIREIRSNVQYRPQRARYKIYIIDEVHMLTGPAFNALLKTLEEPPSHVKFIFATTEASKIPVTILSRCQRFDFSGISLTQLRQRMKEIVASEGTVADDEALELIARRAGGSMRDAQSLLDQLLAFGGERLTVARVHQLLGTAHEERIAAIAGAVLAKDAKQALAQVAEAADKGLQLGELLDQLIEYWRDLMVVQAAGLEDQVLSVTSANRSALETQARSLTPESVMAGLDVLVTAKSRLRNTTHGRIVLEMALVRLARLDSLVGVSQLVQWLQEGGGPAAPARASAASVSEAEKKKLAVEAVPADVPIPLTTESLAKVWIQLSMQASFAVRGELRNSVEQAISGPNALAIRFPHGYNLPEGARKAQMEEAIAKITGQTWMVKLENVAKGIVQPNAVAPETPTQRRRRIHDTVLQAPLTARAKEVLGAVVVDVEEGFGDVVSIKKAADDNDNSDGDGENNNGFDNSDEE